MADNNENLGKVLKRQRLMRELTLLELAAQSGGVSVSHLGRIERGDRFPSARILQKIAKPLGFEETKLFMLAGYLSNQSSNDDKSDVNSYQEGRLDPSVAAILSQEPVKVQRAVIGILSTIKYLANSRELHE